MKILILSTKMPWPPKDGGAIATLNLAVGLARSGADITLLTMNTGKHYFPVEELPGELNDLLKIKSVDVDTSIRPYSLVMNFLFSSYPYIAKRFISKAFKAELLNCLAGTNYDIVQIEGPYLGYYTKFIDDSIHVSLRAHNLEHQIWQLRAKEEKYLLRKIYFKSLSRRIEQLEKRLLRRIDMLVPISNPDAEAFSNMNHKLQVHVSPTGMETEKYKRGKTGKISATGKGELRLGYIGALDWGPNREGLDWFFEKVWPMILKRLPGTIFHVAGRSSSSYFTGTTPPKVQLEGEVDDAISFYTDKDIILVPLLSGSGIRIKILEAMAMGKVVICSGIAAGGLGITNGEHLFVAESPEDYTSLLESLTENPVLIRDTAINARRFVTENFDNLELSKKLISFYKAQIT